MNKKIYFIDYNEDQVCPCAGNSELVKRYSASMARTERELIGIYDTKGEMMEEALEYVDQARHGARKFESFSDEQMMEKIRDAEEVIEKTNKRRRTQAFEIECEHQITPELLSGLLRDYSKKITGKDYGDKFYGEDINVIKRG